MVQVQAIIRVRLTDYRISHGHRPLSMEAEPWLILYPRVFYEVARDTLSYRIGLCNERRPFFVLIRLLRAT